MNGFDIIDKWRKWYRDEYLETPSPPVKPKKHKCPGCGRMTRFRFHFDIPPGPKECFPNECLTCGIFCNYLGEVYNERRSDR